MSLPLTFADHNATGHAGARHAREWGMRDRSHAHLLLQLGDNCPVNKLVNRLKSGSARSVNRIHDRTGPLWARGLYDHAMRRDENVRDTVRYIISNPLRAGLVATLGEYPFWNTAWSWFPVLAKPDM